MKTIQKNKFHLSKRKVISILFVVLLVSFLSVLIFNKLFYEQPYSVYMPTYNPPTINEPIGYEFPDEYIGRVSSDIPFDYIPNSFKQKIADNFYAEDNDADLCVDLYHLSKISDDRKYILGYVDCDEDRIKGTLYKGPTSIWFWNYSGLDEGWVKIDNSAGGWNCEEMVDYNVPIEFYDECQ